MQERNQAELEAKVSAVLPENVRLVYEATYTYHHMIVQARFATLALHVGMATFLLASFFTDLAKHVPTWMFSALGIFLTVAVFILDARNSHLLANCLARGLRYEAALKISPDIGFFGLMKAQDETETPALLGLKIVSHTFASNVLIIVLLAVWLSLLFLPH